MLMYEHLLEEVGLPSVYELACHNSVSTIKQIYGMKPEWFEKQERELRNKYEELSHIRNVSKECQETLLYEMLFNARLHLFNKERIRERNRDRIAKSLNDMVQT